MKTSSANCRRLELCCRLFTALRWENWNSSRIGIDLKTPEMGRFTAGIGRVSVRKGLATKSSLKLRCMLLGLRKWDSPENLSCSKHTCHTCHFKVIFDLYPQHLGYLGNVFFGAEQSTVPLQVSFGLTVPSVPCHATQKPRASFDEDDDSLEDGETAMSGEQDFWLRLVAASVEILEILHGTIPEKEGFFANKIDGLTWYPLVV